MFLRVSLEDRKEKFRVVVFLYLIFISEDKDRIQILVRGAFFP